MYKISSIVGFITIIFLGIIACEGPTGPEGPQGAQGQLGEQGPQGPEGNANVVADTLTLTNDDWLYPYHVYFQVAPGSALIEQARYVELDIPEVTEDVLDAGDVRIFMQNAPAFRPDLWVSLPVDFNRDTYMIHYFYELEIGLIRLLFRYGQNDPGSAVPSTENATLPDRPFKWVVIDGSLVAMMKKAQVDMNDYNQIEAFFKKEKIHMKTGIIQ